MKKKIHQWLSDFLYPWFVPLEDYELMIDRVNKAERAVKEVSLGRLRAEFPDYNIQWEGLE